MRADRLGLLACGGDTVVFTVPGTSTDSGTPGALIGANPTTLAFGPLECIHEEAGLFALRLLLHSRYSAHSKRLNEQQ